ncbi:MAG TPA: CPBP family intramembrane glutamic endopeptidase [Gemmatimonadaceae bacterium]|nr:CPBP family intramembrane glutamic endopeptidase [Gemmatimonadaceae bacterium]
MPLLADHLLIVLLVVLAPFSAVQWRRQMEREIAAGGAEARIRCYRVGASWQWMNAAIPLVLWAAAQRDWSELGLGLSRSWGFAAACALAVAVVALLSSQATAARKDASVAAKVTAGAAAVEYLLPASEREFRAFWAVGLTAGIVEELLYRGYLIWYLDTYLPLWAAAVGAGIVFGVGHAYQGTAGVRNTAVIGVVMAGVYLLAGSLWPAMFIHAAWDMLQVRMFLNARMALAAQI